MSIRVVIEKYDHLARGIAHLNGKVVFVKGALKGEDVLANVIKENKKYIEAETIRVIKKADERIDVLCPFFEKCGGCSFWHADYDEEVRIKLENFKDKGNQGYIEFDFDGSIIDSMIVKEYQIKENEADCKNMTNSKDESIIPGTTIKGLFREYNTKILKTLGLDDKLFLIEDIYGTDAKSESKTHFIGKVLTSDVVVKNPKYCVYNRIKVDRFTGGVVTGGKFDEERVQGDLSFRISLKKLDDNNKAAVGLILLTFRDLGLSKLPIGSSSSIGAGRIKGNTLTIKENDKVVKIEFENGKLICNDMDYVNEAIKAIKNIKKPRDNGSEGAK